MGEAIEQQDLAHAGGPHPQTATCSAPGASWPSGCFYAHLHAPHLPQLAQTTVQTFGPADRPLGALG